MRRLAILALAIAGVLPAQSTWPSAPDSSVTLLTDTNLLGTALSASINSSQTTITVTSAAGLVPNTEVFVDFEAVKITAINSLVLTVQRGVDGTIAASHWQNAKVYRSPGAGYHNALVSAILAMQATPYQVVPSTPSGSCSPNNKVEWVPGGSVYGCISGTWKVIAGGGGTQSATIAFTNQTSVAVAYNLGTNNIIPTVYNASGVIIPGGYTFTLAGDGNNATLAFATPQSGSITVLTTPTQSFSETFTSQATLTLAHNLGTLTPAMAVYQLNGAMLYGATLTPVTTTSAILSFAVPQSGTVVLIRQQ